MRRSSEGETSWSEQGAVRIGRHLSCCRYVCSRLACGLLGMTGQKRSEFYRVASESGFDLNRVYRRPQSPQWAVTICRLSPSPPQTHACTPCLLSIHQLLLATWEFLFSCHFIFQGRRGRRNLREVSVCTQSGSGEQHN